MATRLLPVVSVLLSLLICRVAAVTTVVINGTASHTIPPTLFLQNRAFQQVTPNTTTALTAWHPINGASLTVISDPLPVSSALPNSLQLTVPAGSSGPVGFGNEGYFGIKVDSTWTYNASFYYRFPTASTFSGPVTIGLQTSSGQPLASTTTALPYSSTWKQIFVQLTPTVSGSTTANNFTVTLNGASGVTINFAMFSLFPPTYKGRANGMRVDIATTLAGMAPSFFRLPGGNNLEGQTTATRWQWNATVGPLLDRPGRYGDWGYINTDGLGLMEYMYWCEDVGMQPIMAVWAGYSLGGTSLNETSLAPYIQQAIDQIEFVIGDPTTTAGGALRASLGRYEPFNLTYVEIGNEDFFAATSYVYRWRDFAGNLTAAFPQLRFIATTYAWNPMLTPTPLQYDVHVYQTPSWFAQNAFYYDSFERNGTTYFEGEYAAISTNASNLYGAIGTGRLMYPTMESSTGEAAFMTGLERNSDIVFAASYAPLLNHIVDSQWTPNLVSFDAGTVYASTSYYAQQLFSVNRGDVYLPSTLPTVDGTLFWSVTRRTATQELLIKVSNTIATSAPMTFELPYATVAGFGTAQVLQGSQNTSNSPATPYAAVPVATPIVTGKTFNYTAPGYSVSVLTVNAY
ncbi:glycoside hydrolase family 51 protein [Jaapia argillacea MUCL 33604]|uniref:non-reducing end alpha-L-arabinofuranosidase n=1 Tax=Jaapia argillacea MUCL 33604 TaxID=933084 RepID=A0A067Q2D9_9AGAM|nr:glycoside hydrolase family 51 protein [Jaapia argillacea MUCL 33604]